MPRRHLGALVIYRVQRIASWIEADYRPKRCLPCICDKKRCWAFMPPVMPLPMPLKSLDIWVCWWRRSLSSWTVVSEPRAMRSRRLPLMMARAGKCLFPRFYRVHL
jgi:hypothetical protein